MNILLSTPSFSSFVKKDIRLIETKHSVIASDFNIKLKIEVIIKMLGQLILLSKHIKKTDLIICRFIGYHSFLPALFGKVFNVPVLAILGGNECHYFPSISYGNYAKSVYSFFTKLSFRLVNHIAPVDDTLVISDYDYDKSGAPKQGYLYFCPWIKAPHTVIYNGYDPDKFLPLGKVKKPNSFLTVALDINGKEFYRKGIDLILQLAPFFKHCSFTMVGKYDEIDSSLIPENVTFITRVDHDKLVNLYNENEFYMQLSLAEGFPNSLCEAMLCGCIPIGSNVFAIPKIISDAGFILQYKNLNDLKSIVQKALICDKINYSNRAREQIIDNYHIKKRQDRLLTLIDELCK